MRVYSNPFAAKSGPPTPHHSHPSLNTLAQGEDTTTPSATIPPCTSIPQPSSSPGVQRGAPSPTSNSSNPSTINSTASSSNCASVNSGKSKAACSKKTPVFSRTASTSLAPPLAVNTLRPPPTHGSSWKSNSANFLPSPQQLERIVIESLITPIQGPSDDVYPIAHVVQEKAPGQGSSIGASDRTRHEEKKNDDDVALFSGGMFAPENAQTRVGSTANDEEERGIPWMLYRQRSHSTGVAVAGKTTTQLDVGLGSNRVRSMSATSGHAAAAPAAWHNRPSAENSSVLEMEGSCWEPSTDTEKEGSMYVHRHSHRSAIRRSGSNSTGGKSYFSAYRKLRESGSSSEQDRSSKITAAAAKGTPEFFVRTESLGTDITSTRAVDVAEPQPFFNRQIRRAQQLRNMYHNRIMDTSSPLSNCCSNTSFSTALTFNSNSSSCTHTSSLSVVSGNSRDSEYKWTSSVHTAASSTQYSNAKYSSSGTKATDALTLSDSQQNQEHVQCQSLRQHQHRNQQKPTERSTGILAFINRAFTITSTPCPQSSTTETTDRSTHQGSSSCEKPFNGKSAAQQRRQSCKLHNQPPKLTSTLYYITGLEDLRRARKRARKRSTLGYLSGRRGQTRLDDMVPDAKAFFSNERTYMHWIKFGLLIGSMALTLLSFSTESTVAVHVGLILVAVAMSTLVYATAIFHLRHKWMIQLRKDQKYYDEFGPTILFLALFMAYATNVVLTMNRFVGDYSDDRGYNFFNNNINETSSLNV
ncbi:Phosphate metabolism transcription protein [Mortierella claussenii]|nr:Phosphate metabolism transcription protein [Mortierella claussenii]